MLHAVGLSATEQVVYELLVTQPPLRAEDLAELAVDQPWAGSVAAILRRLEDLGLVARLPGDQPRHAVVPVDVATEALIAAKESSLAAARQRIGQLTARFGQAGATADPLDLVEIVQGRAAVQARLDAFVRTVRSEMCGFDAPPYLNDPGALSTYELERLRSGIRYRVIYDRQGVDQPGRLADIDQTVSAGELARVTDLPMKLALGDQPLAMLPIRNDPVDLECWLVVHDPVLLAALAALFEMYWERAVPLNVARDRPELIGAGPDDTERALLPLLLAGLTDRQVADHLGWHERTAHRHLHAMMTRLDATSRFQAGYQAVRRGWLSDTAATDG